MTAPEAPSVTLKPCPFCDGEASAEGHARYNRPLPDTWWEDGSEITECFFVNCTKCGISNGRPGIVGGYQTRAEAIAAWNTRTAAEAEAKAREAALVALLERTQRLLDRACDWIDKEPGPRGPAEEAAHTRLIEAIEAGIDAIADARTGAA